MAENLSLNGLNQSEIKMYLTELNEELTDLKVVIWVTVVLLAKAFLNYDSTSVPVIASILEKLQTR